MSQAWTILSGKGGVGKSTVASALGEALARRQMQCCLVDTDMGLRSLDMLLGMHNKVVYDVLDVARKDCKLKYAMIRDTAAEGLWLLPAAQLDSGRGMDADAAARIVRKLKKRVAYVLLDAPAGLGRGVRELLPATDHTLLVATPDDVCIRDAERAIALVEEAGKPRPMLVVNRVRPDLVARGDMYSPQTVAATLDVPLLGYIPEDAEVLRALNRHDSFMHAQCPAQAAVERICQRFLGEFVDMPPVGVKRKWFWGKRR